MIFEEQSAIVFQQQQPPFLLRLFILVLGLGLSIVIPTPFIIHADWSTPSLTLVLAAACIIAPVIVGGFFIVLAFVSASEVRLDPVSGQATRVMRGPLLRRRESYPLSAVGSPELVRLESVEDGPTYVLRLRLPKWPVVEMREFSNRDEAERWQARIKRVLGRP